MIEILHYEAANRGKTIGYVDVKLEMGKASLIFRRIPHLQSGERRWFNLPTFAKEENGMTKYLPYFQFAIELNNGAFLEKIAEMTQKYIDEHNIKLPQGLDFDDKLPETDLPF